MKIVLPPLTALFFLLVFISCSKEQIKPMSASSNPKNNAVDSVPTVSAPFVPGSQHCPKAVAGTSHANKSVAAAN